MTNQSSSLTPYKSYWSQLSGNLGGIYPYFNLESPSDFSLRISDIISYRKQSKLPIELDKISLAMKLCLPYLLANRTLIKNVSHTPWMSNYLGNGFWQSAPLPPHGRNNPIPSDFTVKLKNSLLEEGKTYTDGASTVGILLSGGMDSRIVAGVLRELQLRKDGLQNIVAITWGDEKCRDVVYAKKIANRFGWEFLHFPISAETLNANIKLAGQAGAEVSPLHFHAIAEVAKLKGINTIVAGSYGDSVGRAEFSGRHVSNLKPIAHSYLDKFGLVKGELLSLMKQQVKSDATSSIHLTNLTNNIRNCEIEQEMHYMRRMLQYCMQLIATEIPIYQLFTAPSVFGLMWGLNPEVRNNEWYARLLNLLPGNLLDIPWARTGYRYDQKSGLSDNLTAKYHKYGYWLRHDLKDTVLAKVNSEKIYSLGIFNEMSLNNLLTAWSKAKTQDNNSLDEVISWLASLHDFIEIYDIQENSDKFNAYISDIPRAYIGGMYAEAYIAARNRLRN